MNTSLLRTLAGLYFLLTTLSVAAQNKVVVFQSDFGLKDGAVSAMKGVATGVSGDLKLYDLTHEIPAYNIWEAAFRLEQTVPYWPAGTVIVSVVDPGVGTDRKSVVLKTNSGHYIVTPDNGTLTLVARSLGIAAIREIDEAANRRKGSQQSYTFHGRDVYAYTAARLAAGTITFEQVGPELPRNVVSIPYQPAVKEGNTLKGSIAILDVQYGNIWTNISADLFRELQPAYGDILHLTIYHKGKQVYKGDAPYCATFGAVAKGKPLGYLNSLMELSFALNLGSFADTYHIGSGHEWSVTVSITHKK
ncbi:SAM hydrolase/SAM-dependent halogenase family protein [Chitinophaga nivalis]|uniref:S-adenosyl-l-methionine hydroxide adenosyltransferase family protein n=1 Tax=Chitinophaga nivalis TaxID=2991709 RepID=A0ABT3IHY9_9BACT|nr:S-adenosyl-l-methionine hydroxide adenosyltransferase family protein [Chitinophaga nivalis]MCW3466737.1 S-adenosyl-l-methionine hydroxide adenosyltransferase family protein [Chitinophaga nivalis]MCW3483572.1 S-adenosyl-l-methionine hydroxide adenosyltransferase family protein [Chitinophaga nivalis]